MSESIPMPSPKPPRMPTGSQAAIGDPLDVIEERITRRRVEIEAVGERVDDIATQLGREPDPKVDADEGAGIRGRVAMLEAFVGAPANAVRGRLATGAYAWLEKLTAAIDKLTVELTTERTQRDEQSKALAQKREPRDRVAWIAVGALVATIVAQSVPALARWFVSHLR